MIRREARKLSGESGTLVYQRDAEQATARIDADYEKIGKMFERMGDP